MRKLLAALLLLCALAPAHAACTTGGFPFILQNNTLADATQVMANFNQISSGVAANCAGSGINNDITALNALATPIQPSQGGTPLFVAGATGGSANAQTATVASNFTLTAGYHVAFIANFTNTGAMTLSVNGTAATNVNNPTGAGLVALTGGEVFAGNTYLVRFDGAVWQLIDAKNGPLSASTLGTSGLATLAQLSVTGTSSHTGKASFTSTDSMAVANGTTGQRNGSPSPGDLRYNSTLAGVEYWNGSVWTVLGQAPTVQRFTSGSSATYTPSTGMVRIKVRMCGGGGGGGAQTTNNGTAGNNTSFGSWTAVGGSAGVVGAGGGAAGGSGGTGGGSGSGTLVNRVAGGSGGGGISIGAGSFNSGGGGMGGSSAFGGAGAGGSQTGGNAAANSCSGGGGGGGATGSGVSGSGGGAGEDVEFWMTAAQVGATQTYTVGAAANGGAAGAQAGGTGAAGLIVVEEYYQ